MGYIAPEIKEKLKEEARKLRAEGMTVEDIGKQLGISSSTVSNYTSDIGRQSKKNKRKIKYQFTDEQFIDAVKNSFSIAGVLKKLNLKKGGNYRIVYEHVEELNINTDHFTGQGHLKGKTHNFNPSVPLEDILIKSDKHLNSNNLRQRLIKENIFRAECSECKMTHWLGEPMRFQLDHIDGDNTNNKIDNLRIMCPNCHSQTPTFRGRNKKRKRLAKT